MSTKQQRNLLKVLLLSQELVSAIDEVENAKEGWQQDVKAQSKRLRETIIKKHGQTLNNLYNIQDGEFIQGLGKIVSNISDNLIKMDLTQWGVMSEFTDMVIENPHITFAEEEKDVLITMMRGELKRAADMISESEDKVDKLHTRMAKMSAIGNQPYNIISSELIEIKRYLRKIREGNANEKAQVKDQPCSGDSQKC